jgi:hypothetical protein
MEGRRKADKKVTPKVTGDGRTRYKKINIARPFQK